MFQLNGAFGWGLIEALVGEMRWGVAARHDPLPPSARLRNGRPLETQPAGP